MSIRLQIVTAIAMILCGCTTATQKQIALPPCWIEEEGSYSGIWTRQGNTDKYSAKWTRGHEVVTDEVQFAWIYDDVICFNRLNIDGRYIGFLTHQNGNAVITRGVMSWSAETWTAKGCGESQK